MGPACIRRSPRAPWSALALLLAAPQAAVPQSRDPGWKAPALAHQVVPERLVHADGDGRAPKELLALAGARGVGFAALWRDARYGAPAPLLLRVRPDGRPAGAERPIPPAPRREEDGACALALGGDGSALAVWTGGTLGARAQVRARAFDAEGAAAPAVVAGVDPERLASFVDLDALSGGRGRGGEPAEVGALCAGLDARGDAWLAWTWRGAVLAQELSARGRTGKLEVLNRRGPLARGAPVLASDGEAHLLAWHTPEGMRLLRRARRGPDVEASAVGHPLDAASDGEGGFWLLVDAGEHLVLRRIDARCRARGEDVQLRRKPYGRAQLAAWDEGVALLEQVDAASSREGDAPGRVELRFLGPDGAPGARRRMDVLPEGELAALARLASAGDRLLVAWVRSDGALVGRLLRAGAAELEPAVELSSDTASGRERAAALASDGAGAALAVWIDATAAGQRLVARRLAADGSLGEPFALPAALGARPHDGETAATASDTSASEPAGADRVAVLLPRDLGAVAAALGDDGRGLVAWCEGQEGRWRVRVQVVDAAGRSAGAVLDLDPEDAPPEPGGLAAAPLPDGRGFAVAWTRKGTGLVARRVARSGEAAGPAWRISVDEAAFDPALAQLDDGRLAVAWDEPDGPRSRRLVLRFLGTDLRPLGEPLRPEPIGRGPEHHPALAPAEVGGKAGFVLVFGAGGGPERDVLARFFDADGRPAGRPLGLSSADGAQDRPWVARLPDGGGWLASWTDDLSGVPQPWVRRIEPSQRSLGPVRSLVPNEGEPWLSGGGRALLAPLAGGCAALWEDARRGRGLDVRIAILGASLEQAPR